jgi:predicted permease
MISSLIHDLQYSFRQWLKNPGFALTVVFILSLGIGASTAIFSAVNPILFKPLPYLKPERIVMVWARGDDGARLAQTFHTFRELVERSHSFESAAVMDPWQPSLTGASQAERIDGQRVSAEYFATLGVRPVLGRDFQRADDIRNGPRVAILSDGLWKKLGADPGILGQQVKFDDDPYTVIGVMAPDFSNVLLPSTEAWTPLQYDPANASIFQTREWGHHLRMVARLKQGASTEQARKDLDWIAHNPISQFPRPPWASLEAGLIANSLQADVASGVKPALLVILGAVGLVLLIACVNVTSLLLARGAQRRGEFAMRAALGAQPNRLVRQLLTESVLLALLSGGLGLFMAQLGVRALIALSPADLPRLNAIHVDSAAFGFAFAVAALVGLMVGLIPALQASRSDPHEGLQKSSMRAAGGHHRTRRTLVVAESAIALVLLINAGLLFRSLNHLFSIDPGFDASHLLTMQVQESGHRYDAAADRARFFDQALDAVRQIPGVESAAFTSQLPLSGDSDAYGVQFDFERGNDGDNALRYEVSPDYFKVMHIPLRRGRLLNERDRPGAPLAALISESFAKRKFPGQDPIGRRLRAGPNIDGGQWSTIVGVVGDVKQASLALTDSDAFYTSTTQWSWVDNVQSLVVRTRSDAAAAVPAIRNAIWSVDKDQPIFRVARMDDLLAKSEAERRFVLILLEVFGLVALLLAATGIYGVLSGSVTERIREIGVRAALGATRMDILGLVIRQGMMLTAIGVAVGLAGAFASNQTLATLLYGIQRLDPLTYMGMILLLAGVSAIACGVPAWRAARVDPAITLRAE